jgi:hypothetical protein
MTLTITKKALASATKSFTANPSATNWCEMHRAMEAHQNAHYAAKEIAMHSELAAMHNSFYAKSIANPTHNT